MWELTGFSLLDKMEDWEKEGDFPAGKRWLSEWLAFDIDGTFLQAHNVNRQYLWCGQLFEEGFELRLER